MSDLEDYQIQYDYSSKIIPHKELGVKKNGKNSTIKKGVKAIDDYIDALKTGKTRAVMDQNALGNKYFHNLGMKCKNVNTGLEEDLYTYVNNVPSSPNDGLITGIEDKLNTIDTQILSNLIQEDSDDIITCKKILCNLRNDNHEERIDGAYVSVEEHALLKDNGNCKDFVDSEGDGIVDTFRNLNDVSSKLPQDSMITSYYTLLSILGLYFIYNCTLNKKF